MRRGFTLRELVVALIVTSLASVVCFPVIFGHGCAIIGSKVTSCGSNLSQLAKAMYNYSITKVEPEGSWPPDIGVSGGRVWRLLYETGEVDDPAFLMCPLETQGRVYRGPRADWTDPGISCRPQNHGGFDGPIPGLSKSGDPCVAAGEEKWRWMLERTED